jgi:GH15 family glucan-1,4-alpha-glucosidase
MGDLARDHGYPIVRRVEGILGSMRIRMRCEPAFGYALVPHTVRPAPHGVEFESPLLTLHLASSTPMTIDEPAAVADLDVAQGQQHTFVLSTGGSRPLVDAAEVERAFQQTVDDWHAWIQRCTYRGRWREMVHRSALTLKLLTYQPTGAIIAAPTTSLPEAIGGARNWDYRYTWIRDASFTVYALLRIGFTEEARAFMGWVHERLMEVGEDGSLQLMYAIDGQRELPEEVFTHLEGYRGSRPVRVGNAASDQVQIDMYGELLDAAYLSNKYVAPVGHDEWLRLRRIINHVCDIWQWADAGIWEVRGGPRHFVHSKLMCWVALDRGLRLADKRSFPADRSRWIATRDAIYDEIMERGWSDDRQAFVQAFDNSTLDASVLLMPLVFFVAPTDPRFQATVEAIRRDLTAGSLVYRYDPVASPDGLDGTEGTFSMCSFWLVEALTRAGRVGEARMMFERMLGYANHLGLFAEEAGFAGEALGNFPQGFTHLALISAAVNLDRALDGRKHRWT